MEGLSIINIIFLIILTIIEGLNCTIFIFSNGFNNTALSQKETILGKIINKYPCTIGLSIVFNADFDGIITDFSKYEDYNLIVFTSYEPKDPPEDLVGIEMLTFIPNCIVYEYEGGYFDWEEL